MTQKRLNSTTWILALFLASLLILLITAMYQIDRQLGKMSAMQATMSEQASDIRELRTSLNEFKRKLSDGSLAQNNGIAQSVTTTNTASAFQRAKLASQQPDYAQGDWNINVFGNNLKTITPIVSTDAYASDVQNYVLESLIS
ncbi:MAG: FtsL-like putative cell division protein, partial [Thiotrichaceae bacterium]